jgi:regulator of RNase E activity RraA
MQITTEIIKFCRDNRVSTTEVADALGKSGVLDGLKPLTENTHAVGPIRNVFTAFNSNWDVHDQVQDVKPGEVVIIHTHGFDSNRAVIGDLVSKYVLLYRGAAAIVVLGSVRDVAAIRRERYPVWALGCSPLGSYNTPERSFPKDIEQEIRSRLESGIAVCDDGGVTVIERSLVTKGTLTRLHRIEVQEDIWFYCLDTLKWTTKKIVCDKAYLKETDLLSKVHLEQLNELNLPLDRK